MDETKAVTTHATTAVARRGRKPKQEAVQHSAEQFIQQAIAANAPIDTIERLMTLREKMNAETAKKAYNDAMAAFQAECPIIKKTKSVNTKSGGKAYSYAPIESVILQVKHLLQKHGFRYSTSIVFANSQVKAICHVTHSLGHTESTEMEVPLGNKTDVMSQSQVVAAASTFAKRYAFLNAFGIMTGDEDTDATKGKQEKAAEVAADAATQAQKDEIDALCVGQSITKAQFAQMFRKKYGISVTTMTKNQADGVIAGLKLQPKK